MITVLHRGGPANDYGDSGATEYTGNFIFADLKKKSHTGAINRNFANRHTHTLHHNRYISIIIS